MRNTLHSMCLVMNQAFLRCPEKWHSMIRTTTSYFRPNVALLLAVLLVMRQVRQPHLISHPHHPGLLCLRLPHALHASSGFPPRLQLHCPLVRPLCATSTRSCSESEKCRVPDHPMAGFTAIAFSGGSGDGGHCGGCGRQRGR